MARPRAEFRGIVECCGGWLIVRHGVDLASRVVLERSQSALGGFYRRMKGRLGAAEAITATAHKLARIIYRLIKHGEAYVRQGMENYERKFRERKLYALRKTAISMGFNLVAGASRADALASIEKLAWDELKCLHMEVSDPYFKVEDGDALGFTVDSYTSYRTDLTKSEDEIFNSMDSACRRCVRKAPLPATNSTARGQNRCRIPGCSAVWAALAWMHATTCSSSIARTCSRAS